jgi:hypothetical protein
MHSDKGEYQIYAASGMTTLALTMCQSRTKLERPSPDAHTSAIQNYPRDILEYSQDSTCIRVKKLGVPVRGFLIQIFGMSIGILAVEVQDRLLVPVLFVVDRSAGSAEDLKVPGPRIFGSCRFVGPFVISGLLMAAEL